MTLLHNLSSSPTRRSAVGFRFHTSYPNKLTATYRIITEITASMAQKIDKMYEEAVESGLLPGISVMAGDKSGWFSSGIDWMARQLLVVEKRNYDF